MDQTHLTGKEQHTKSELVSQWNHWQMFFYFVPGRVAKYCDDRVCLCVCLSLCVCVFV